MSYHNRKKKNVRKVKRTFDAITDLFSVDIFEDILFKASGKKKAKRIS